MTLLITAEDEDGNMFVAKHQTYAADSLKLNERIDYDPVDVYGTLETEYKPNQFHLNFSLSKEIPNGFVEQDDVDNGVDVQKYPHVAGCCGDILLDEDSLCGCDANDW